MNVMKLSANNLSKSFGKNVIFKNINFELSSGELILLVGGNGAGKTTLFNILSGFLSGDSGSLTCTKKNYTVSRAFQDLRLVKDLTVKENVMLSFREQEGEKWWNALNPTYSIKRDEKSLGEKAEIILNSLDLKSVQEHKTSQLSLGQSKLLTIACLIANSGDLILLDEPFAGVNDSRKEQIMKAIDLLVKDKKIVMVIEHSSNELLARCNKRLEIRDGQLTTTSQRNSVEA